MKRDFVLNTKPEFNAHNFFKEFKKLQYEGHFKGVISVTELNFEKETENSKEEFLMREIYGVK